MGLVRWLAAVAVLLMGPLLPAAANSSAPSAEEATCVAVDDVDSCWKAGVAAERRGDRATALVVYDRSCAAGFTIYGCYEAGKIAFHDQTLRDYGHARMLMARVCASSDIGMGPYGCTYLGNMQRHGLGGERQARESAHSFVRACFTHNADHYLDGRGCAALADELPAAGVMGRSDATWPRDYLRFLAYAMGCTDGMPALCTKAGEVYRLGEAMSADWLVVCEDQLAGRAPAGTCPRLADRVIAADDSQRQTLRRTLADLFGSATDLRADQ